MPAVKGTLARRSWGRRCSWAQFAALESLVGCHGRHLLGILLMMQELPSQLGLVLKPWLQQAQPTWLELGPAAFCWLVGFGSCCWVAP